MNELLQQFHFLRPSWLVALVALPVLAWLGSRRHGEALALSRLVDPELLPHLLRGRPRHRSLPVWLVALGWTLTTLALAGPSWNRVSQPLYANRPAQVVAISLSQHMLARDVAPSRMDRARYKARDLLASNKGGLNALIGYAGEAFVVAPLTSDVNSLNDLLDAMSPNTMPVDGNDAGAAIRQGVSLIHDANAGGGSLVLITDQADASADKAARAAAASGVKISVLGVGTPQGGPVPMAGGGFLRDAQGKMILAARDDAALRALAAAGGGRYAPMSADQTDIDALRAQLKQSSRTAKTGQVGDEWQDRGPWLVLPLLLIVALAFRRGWLLVMPLILLPLWPSTASATTWQDLWKRPDQQAAQALKQGKPKQAQQLAHDPAWRAAAAYRAGDYAAAADALSKVPGTDAAYNLGNALARQGKYQQAIQAYDEALKLAPDNADATANRKAVEDWLRQQKSKQQKSDNKNQQNKDGGKGASKPSDDTGQNGKSKSESDQSEKSGDKPDASSDKQDKPGSDRTSDHKSHGDKASEDQSQPQTPQQQAEEKARAEQAKRALKKQMDQALADKPADPKSAHQLGVMTKDDPQSKLPADLQHALQRVPDDPGALLRRKFELQYQQRHGGVANEDDSP